MQKRNHFFAALVASIYTRNGTAPYLTAITTNNAPPGATRFRPSFCHVSVSLDQSSVCEDSPACIRLPDESGFNRLPRDH